MSAAGTAQRESSMQAAGGEGPGDRTKLETTSSQTVGPYLHIGLTWLVTEDLVGPGTSGEPVVIEGRITDADGKPVDDALIEIWQANAHGRYDHPDDTRDLPLEPGFKGFGRVPTDAGGAFRLRTVKPGPVPAADGSMQAPHVNVTIFMRGMLKHLATRIYFPGEPANAADPVLRSVPAGRRDTLIAKPIGNRALQWNVVLQGAGETVFFDY
jgi:protocatechuate 3,4-dioxygenase alpha subunit